MQNNFYAIVPHAEGEQILVLPTSEGWSIPIYHLESSWTPQVHNINAAVQEQLGFHATVRYCPQVLIERDGDKRYASAIYVLLSPEPGWPLPAEARWVNHDEYMALTVDDEWQRGQVAAYFEEEQSGAVPALRPAWGRKGWYSEMLEWAEAELAKHNLTMVGAPEQIKQWDISAVFKAATNDGDIYIKAMPRLYATEPEITAGLARLYPETVPVPLATLKRADEGRLILRDFGGKLLWSEGMPKTAMEDALRLLARMQISAAQRTAELFEMGCRDRRLENMPGEMLALLDDVAKDDRFSHEYIERLQALGLMVEGVCEILAAGPAPQTLLHGDFHSGNVASTDKGYVIFDWTDACVSHPFFDLLTVIDNGDDPVTDDELERLIAAYLGEWEAQGFGSIDELSEMVRMARAVGPLYHAISYWHIDKQSEQATYAELGSSMPHFLNMMLERLETA